MSESLINKYRPQSFAEVMGHSATLTPLLRAMSAPSHSHAYLLTGIRGTGKTTLARLIGQFFECDLIEFDAASNSGVEKARGFIEEGQYLSMRGNGNKMYLIDECHRLSRNAWDAFLKITEEPPNHLYFALCTTEPAKVPPTIISRCYHVQLKPLGVLEMNEYIRTIAELEGWTVASDVINAVIEASEGSPRTALTILQSVHSAQNRDEVKRIITLIDASNPAIEAIQMMLKGTRDWASIKKHILRIDDDMFTDDMGIIGICRYLMAVMRRGNEQEAQRAWLLLKHFMAPKRGFDNKALFYEAIGSILWER